MRYKGVQLVKIDRQERIFGTLFTVEQIQTLTKNSCQKYIFPLRWTGVGGGAKEGNKIDTETEHLAYFDR